MTVELQNVARVRNHRCIRGGCAGLRAAHRACVGVGRRRFEHRFGDQIRNTATGGSVSATMRSLAIHAMERFGPRITMGASETSVSR
jgi:hypothetical protein